jgi:hypothetical protein
MYGSPNSRLFFKGGGEGRRRGFLFTYKDSARDPESNEMEAYSPTLGGYKQIRGTPSSSGEGRG